MNYNQDYNKIIDEQLALLRSNLDKKHEHRFTHNCITNSINLLISKYLEKSSASFENKIALLMKIDELKDIHDLVSDYFSNKDEWKKYRDLAKVNEIQIMEYQARRKAEIEENKMTAFNQT